MSCATTRELLSGYVDGELPPDQAEEVAGHLASCATCAREYEATLETVRHLHERLARYSAPDVLRARIHEAIRKEGSGAAAEQSVEELPERITDESLEPHPEQHPERNPPRRRTLRAGRVPLLRREWRASWRALAAAAILIAALGSGLTLLLPGRRPAEPAVAEEVLTSHIRSLMPDHLTDVRSSDQHNVKPWFNGRLDFSPTVPRLDSAGFPLLGGRLDYVHGRPVAVVVYGRRQHVINVFSWPAESDGDASQSLETRHGYNVLNWRRGGVEYWVASDLNVQELEHFAELLRRGDSAASLSAPTRPSG